MPMSPADRLIASDCVVTRVVNGATVLLNTDTGRYFTLDDVGGRAWTVLTSSPSIEEARDRLLDEYAADPVDLMRDLETLIASLTEQGLVEVGRG
jgi:coenzyme PQQ synthesis protein D (PqqD)